MQRDLSKLAKSSHDVLIIGGGIYGACTAWEAASRGLSVALVEQNDFGSATSANSLKIIHGGLRYLQHADLKRMRESIQERKNLLRIAPHLIHPLPILVPTYGHGIKGREAMKIALLLNDLISCDRNWPIQDASHHIPNGRVISKDECLKYLPGLDSEGLTGGAVFSDAQVYNSERLTLAFLHSADTAGAKLANYAAVTNFLRQGDRVTGAIVQDQLTGQCVEIQAKLIINTAGPWIHKIQGLAHSSSATSGEVLLAKAVNLVVPKFIEQYAVGLSSKTRYRDTDAVLDKGSRFLFTVPWRQASMVGTWYFPYRQSPEDVSVSEIELQTCLEDINAAYPSANLSREDIAYVHCGLLPSNGISEKTGDVQLTKHYRLIDHRKNGLSGLLTVSGVKYTTARDVAQKVIDRAGQMLRIPLTPSQTHRTPIHGGHIRDMEALLKQAQQHSEAKLPFSVVQRLVYTYGTDHQMLLDTLKSTEQSPWEQLLTAEVQHAVRNEMAVHLTDVVLRRTDLGSAGKPKETDLAICANVMAAELGWNTAQKQSELEQVQAFYAQRLFMQDETKTPELRTV